jgi:hypothetical protein
MQGDLHNNISTDSHEENRALALCKMCNHLTLCGGLGIKFFQICHISNTYIIVSKLAEGYRMEKARSTD